MAHGSDRNKTGEGRGRSAASNEAREQGMSGNAGPQASQEPGVGRQPPQGSDRAPAARHQTPAEARMGFEPGHGAPGSADPSLRSG